VGTICGMVSSFDSGVFFLPCETSHATIDIDGFAVDYSLKLPESPLPELSAKSRHRSKLVKEF
jgi:hypothetical protein